MTTKVFPGELRGQNGLSASCDVEVDGDNAPSISKVEPELPDGIYQLLVNGLSVPVQLTNRRWRQIDE